MTTKANLAELFNELEEDLQETVLEEDDPFEAVEEPLDEVTFLTQGLLDLGCKRDGNTFTVPNSSTKYTLGSDGSITWTKDNQQKKSTIQALFTSLNRKQNGSEAKDADSIYRHYLESLEGKIQTKEVLEKPTESSELPTTVKKRGRKSNAEKQSTPVSENNVTTMVSPTVDAVTIPKLEPVITGVVTGELSASSLLKSLSDGEKARLLTNLFDLIDLVNDILHVRASVSEKQTNK